MRVLLGVPWYFPDSIGGTEVYVRGLARQLRDAGVDVAIAAPTTDHQPARYLHESVPVFRYPAPYAAEGEIDLARPEPGEWCDILDAFAPSVVDLHSLTSGLELAHLKAAGRRARTVVTLHIPGVICARGTFMQFGKTPCSGDIARQPCTACRLQAQGVPRVLGRVLARVPRWVAEGLTASPLPHVAQRAFTAAQRDTDRRVWLSEIVTTADRIVAPSTWLVDVLLRNGAPRSKVVLCRQGVDLAHVASTPAAPPIASAFKVGFVGRYDPVKGLHVLIDAAIRVPADLALEVHIWGAARTSAEQRYRQEMIRRANGNDRVIFHSETDDLASVYRNIHVLAVPSEWLETGPLVVLEAQAAGLPIVGSNIGGIAERVTDGEDGILVPFGEVVALERALTSLARDPARVAALRPKRAPRTVADVARETLQTYEALAAAHAA